MGKCLDLMKEKERKRKISLSLIGNKHAYGYIPTKDILKKRSDSLIKAHKIKKFGFKKGFTPWNKNKSNIFSKETLQKMSESHKGQHPLAEFKKGHIPWSKGLNVNNSEKVRLMVEKSKVTINKLSLEGKLIAWNKGKKTGFISKNPEETRRKKSENMLGKNHWNWIDGRSKNKEYKHIQEKEWRNKNKEKKAFLNARRKMKKINAEGSHTFEEWTKLKKKYNYICPMCKKKEPFNEQRCKFLTEDHIVPLSREGTDYIKNIQPLCLDCNLKKHTQTIFFEHKDTILSKY